MRDLCFLCHSLNYFDPGLRITVDDVASITRVNRMWYNKNKSVSLDQNIQDFPD